MYRGKFFQLVVMMKEKMRVTLIGVKLTWSLRSLVVRWVLQVGIVKRFSCPSAEDSG